MTINQATDQNATFDQRDWQVGTAINVNNNNYNTYINEDTIPDCAHLLPYLADRSGQAGALSELMQKLLQIDRQRIVLCLMPGPQNEIHYGLMERFDKIMLPHILADLNKARPNHNLTLPWPEQGFDIEASIAKLKNDLAGKLNLGNQQEKGDLEISLTGIKNHLSLRYNILDSGWSKSEQALLDKWIEYWLNFPKLNNNNLVIIFLCLQYVVDEGGSMLSKLFGSSRTKNMREYVEQQKQRQDDNLIVLDELSPLSHQHLYDWAFNVCPCVDTKLDVGRLQAKTIKLCPNKVEKPLGELLDDMEAAVKAAYYKT